MKSLIVAAAAMVLGTALGFLICGATVRHCAKGCGPAEADKDRTAQKDGRHGQGADF